MSACPYCFGLGWKPRRVVNIDGETPEHLVRCAPCPATGQKPEDPVPLWIVEKVNDHGDEGNLKAWQEVVDYLDAWCHTAERMGGPVADFLNIAIVDCYQRALKEVAHYEDELKMRRSYAGNKATGDRPGQE